MNFKNRLRQRIDTVLELCKRNISSLHKAMIYCKKKKKKKPIQYKLIKPYPRFHGYSRKFLKPNIWMRISHFYFLSWYWLKGIDSIDHSGSVIVCLLRYWREKVLSAQKTLLKKPLQEKEIDHSMEKMMVTVLI